MPEERGSVGGEDRIGNVGVVLEDMGVTVWGWGTERVTDFP